MNHWKLVYLVFLSGKKQHKSVIFSWCSESMRQHFNWDLLACWDVIELIADSVEVQSSSIWKLFSWTEVHLLQISTAFHVWKYDFKLFKMVSFLEDLDSTSWPNAGFWIAVSTLGKVNEIDTEFSCQGRYCLFSYQSLHRRLTHKIYLIFSDKWVYTWLLIKQYNVKNVRLPSTASGFVITIAKWRNTSTCQN